MQRAAPFLYPSTFRYFDKLKGRGDERDGSDGSVELA